MSNVTKEQVVEFLENLTLLQAAELVKELNKFGVSAAAPVAVAALVVLLLLLKKKTSSA